MITPLGWERDRATLLALSLRVHRVHLLYRTDHEETAKFVTLVRSDLESAKTEVRTVELGGTESTREFEWLLFHVARLIVEEHERQNIVYVNMSASGKVAAAAATIAAMFHRDKVKALIHVRPSRYAVESDDVVASYREHGLAIGLGGLYYMPLFHIDRPPVGALEAAVVLYEHGPMKYATLIEQLRDRKVSGFEDFRLPPLGEAEERKKEITKWTARLKRSITEPFDGTYFETIPSRSGPDKLLRLTPQGYHLALLTGKVSKLK